MKIKDLSSRQKDEVIELECQNIIPILASVGINLTRQDMVNEVESFQDDEIILSEDQDGINGFLVFIFKEDYLLIKTFNLKKYNNLAIIKNLLDQIVNNLKLQNIEKIKSQAHLTNKKSINFHIGMGFREVKGNEYFVEYETTKNEIVKKINSRLTKLA